MDAAVLIPLTLACLLAWLVVIFDKASAKVYRVIGVCFGVPCLLWYLGYLIGETRSPVWNDLQGGPAALVALALGAIAFLARDNKPKAPPSDGLPI